MCMISDNQCQFPVCGLQNDVNLALIVNLSVKLFLVFINIPLYGFKNVCQRNESEVQMRYFLFYVPWNCSKPDSIEVTKQRLHINILKCSE